LWACSSTGLVRDLADEAEGSFRADHQVGEDVDRIGEVDQRVQAVAGRVLEPELVADAARQASRPRASPAPARRGPRRARAAASRTRPGSAASRVSSTVPSAKTTAQAGERVVAVLRRATAHAAGVVGGDAADHRGVDRGRIRGRSCGPAAQAGDWLRRRSRPAAA
jgi:hypothetical protein